MTTPHTVSRFLLLPQPAEVSTRAEAPVLRRYSLARLAAPAFPARPQPLRQPRPGGS